MTLAIASRGGGSQTSATTTHTVDFGTAPSSGQLLLVLFRRDGDDGGPDITSPAGWSTVGGGYATDFDAYVYAKVAGSSEPSTYDWTTSASCTSGHRRYVIDGFTNTIADGIDTAANRAVFALLAAPDPPLVDVAGTSEAIGIVAAVWSGSSGAINSYPTDTVNGGAHTASNANIGSSEDETITLPWDPDAFSLSVGATTLAVTIVVSNVAAATNNGSGAITENPDTVEATAVQTNVSSAAITEQADTLAASAAQNNQALAAVTETADSVSAAATQTVSGSVAATETGDTLAASATQLNAGASAITEADDTVATTTTQANSGSAAITEAIDDVIGGTDATIVGSAAITETADSVATTSTQVNTGSAAITEASDTVAGDATGNLLGSAAITELSDTASASAAQTNTGSAAISESSDALLAQTEGTTNTASAAITESSDSVSASASQTNGGIISITEQSDGINLTATEGGSGPTRCCCIDCQGCCFPYDYLEPPAVMTAGNYAQIIRWVIDAPNCPELDGQTGQFSPETTGPHDPLTTCGFCLCYNNTDKVITLDGTARFEVGESCGATPCGITLCFGLQCARTRPVANLEECCNQFRLIVVFIGGYPTGGQLVDTSSQCFEGEGIGDNANFPGCNITEEFPAEIARELIPAFCQCEDNEVDPPVPFEVVFNLSDLAFGCPDGDFPLGSPCAGFSRCCTPTTCSLEDATVTLTRL